MEIESKNGIMKVGGKKYAIITDSDTTYEELYTEFVTEGEFEDVFTDFNFSQSDNYTEYENVDKYQDWSEKTAYGHLDSSNEGNDSENVVRDLALGLNGEAGEIAEHAKRLRRGDGSLEDIDIKEIGDTLWYLTRLANELGYDMSEVIEANVEKLEDRNDRNVIRGSGDDR